MKEQRLAQRTIPRPSGHQNYCSAPGSTPAHPPAQAYFSNVSWRLSASGWFPGPPQAQVFFWKETVLYISRGPERFAGAAGLISFQENGPGSSVRVTDGVGSGDIQVVIPWDIQSVREEV